MDGTLRTLQRQAVAPCDHALVVDEEPVSGRGLVPDERWRACLLCGVRYDRAFLLRKLRLAIQDRYRLPTSPWTAAERSDEAIW